MYSTTCQREIKSKSECSCALGLPQLQGRQKPRILPLLWWCWLCCQTWVAQEAWSNRTLQLSYSTSRRSGRTETSYRCRFHFAREITYTYRSAIDFVLSILCAGHKIFRTWLYSQLSTCGHLAITDTPIIRTAAKSPAKINYRRLNEINFRYYGLSLLRTLTRGPEPGCPQ